MEDRSLLRQGERIPVLEHDAESRLAGSGPDPDQVLRLRELLRAVRESQELMATLLPVGDGLLCAVRQGPVGPAKQRS